jgi:type II secretory pathway pseudopilin PulG
MKQHTSHNQKGFTLIELLVSLSLFIIIVLALVGALYTVNDASRKVQAMRTVMDNLSFAMESMSRTIRTSEAIEVTCNGGVPNCSIDSGIQGYLITMNSTLGAPEFVEYKWERNPGQKGGIYKRTAPLDTSTTPYQPILAQQSTWQSITSPEIDIENAAFYITGASPADGLQPAVIVQMEGVATVKGATTIPFAIQTYLSQRTPEL